MWPDPIHTRALLDAARAGGGEAVDSLLEGHRAGVRRVVAARFDAALAARADVSDIVQETLLEAHRRLPEYLRAQPLPFHLWLRCLARDQVVDALRAQRAHKRDVAREAGHLGSRAFADRSTRDLGDALHASGASPATVALRHELVARLHDAMRRLDDIDREVLVMRHHEQLTNQEVARLLDLGEPAAAMRYARALRRLQALVAADDASRRDGSGAR